MSNLHVIPDINVETDAGPSHSPHVPNSDSNSDLDEEHHEMQPALQASAPDSSAASTEANSAAGQLSQAQVEPQPQPRQAEQERTRAKARVRARPAEIPDVAERSTEYHARRMEMLETVHAAKMEVISQERAFQEREHHARMEILDLLRDKVLGNDSDNMGNLLRMLP